ncbi:putative aldehyde dehydrogenase family 3 member H1-like [Capsicum annuum]|uniref:dnaJ homolog subfamily B member 4-like n=1 Tax=Capsicum annuum TaxID=4072 RepID=UPI001FB11F0E|nr:dnaJ homolog subfamily B member 4-like [Capsicum annuum]KAF3644770.1 putative aldehyde dehydrogenase family 3 member H1-like [Capsicum annuum]KAF3652191.1 putative aldehyde dehydrogenase family 3 member H1-like [Capsicum annuum]
MADHSRATSHEFCSSFGFGSVCKACKSFVSILSPKKTHQNPKSNILEDHHQKANVKQSSVDEAIDDIEVGYKHNEGSKGGRLNNKHQNNGGYYYTSSPTSSPPGSRSTSPSRLSRTISRIFRTTSVKNHNLVHSNNGNGGGGGGGGGSGPALGSTLSRSVSRMHDSHHVDMTAHIAQKSFSRSVSQLNGGVEAPTASTTLPATFSGNASRRSSTPIMFSNSSGLVKPPATEETLECTLDELCFGCVKKMKVTRVANTDNGLTEEEEELTINLKPGWTKGTKITFEGKGNERPGISPADVIFVIAEKRHPLFRRDGNNLELAVEIPLVKALTGCTISINLLGGEKMSLTVDDIICPGYEKIIAGQGMPKSKENGNRGNLIVTFLVAFPTELTEEQRSDVVTILQDCC